MIPAINNEKNRDTNDLICVKTCFVDCFMGPKEEDEVSWMTPEHLISTLLSNMHSTAYTSCSSLEECLALNPGKEELVRDTYKKAEKRREEILLKQKRACFMRIPAIMAHYEVPSPTYKSAEDAVSAFGYDAFVEAFEELMDIEGMSDEEREICAPPVYDVRNVSRYKLLPKPEEVLAYFDIEGEFIENAMDAIDYFGEKAIREEMRLYEDR